jgi:hypothetical protein
MEKNIPVFCPKDNKLAIKSVIMESESVPGFEFWLGLASIVLAVFYKYRDQVFIHRSEFE